MFFINCGQFPPEEMTEKFGARRVWEDPDERTKISLSKSSYDLNLIKDSFKENVSFPGH